MLQDGTLLLYCTASWCMGRNTAYQIGGEVKHWLCRAVICCRTHWTFLNTVLMQEEKNKKKYFEWFEIIPNHSKSERKIRAVMQPTKCQAFQVLGLSLQGPSSRFHHLNPVVPVDNGRQRSLAKSYFTWGGKKQEDSTLWIWRSEPLLERFVDFVSRACDRGPCRSCVWEASRCSDVQVELFWQV